MWLAANNLYMLNTRINQSYLLCINKYDLQFFNNIWELKLSIIFYEYLSDHSWALHIWM